MRIIAINPAFCFGGRDPGEGATDRVHFSDGGREIIATVAANTKLIRTKQRTSITIRVETVPIAFRSTMGAVIEKAVQISLRRCNRTITSARRSGTP